MAGVGFDRVGEEAERKTSRIERRKCILEDGMLS